MSLESFFETRPLKRSRLGPADVYPQDPRQKEDELTSVNVKQGFMNTPQFSDEYMSAHQFHIDAAQLNQSFGSILTQKQVVNTFNDAGKKRPQLFKENFMMVTAIVPKLKLFLQDWFKGLAGGKNLSHCCKRVPIFSQKDYIFQTLAEYDVPLIRATWFIKMTAAYPLTLSDIKTKKRATPDLNLDWTQAICKFLREQLSKLNQDNSAAMSNQCMPSHISVDVGSVGIGPLSNHQLNTVAFLSRDDLEKQLKYISNLAHYMYTEGLLDKNDFISWLTDEFDSIKLNDEIALSYFMPFVLQYTKEVVLNQLIARRFSFVAARHLQRIFSESNISRSGSPQIQSGRNTPASIGNSQLGVNSMYPTQAQLKQRCPDYLYCVAHSLACVIQCTALCCTGALVWYPPTDPKFVGSPMDLLPCAPSALLLPDVDEDDEDAKKEADMTKDLLREKEQEIVNRSRASEMRWSTDKFQESTAGHTINLVLSSLEALDRQNFDSRDPVDSLYQKIFNQPQGKDNSESQFTQSAEDSVIGLLCEWAITSQRLGQHRAAVVAKLLDLRQAYHEQDDVTDEQTVPMDNSMQQQTSTKSIPYFQNLIFTYLDRQAPILKNPANTEELQSFKNLILLIYELIDHDVFSHDRYVNTLISRGEIIPGQIDPLPIFKTPNTVRGDSPINNQCESNTSNWTGKPMENRTDDDGLNISHDNKIESNELEFLSNTESVFSPDSRQDRHFLDAVRSVNQGKGNQHDLNASNSHLYGSIWGYGQSRHIQYVMHFPLPFQVYLEDEMSHEWNQRMMILYGAGRQKNEVKREMKKVTKHLIRLVQNKIGLEGKPDSNVSITWTPGSKKGKKSNQSSHSELLSRCRALSYFDQHKVTASVAKTLLTSINNYISERATTLPQLKVIVLLFDLMEEGLNIGGLIQLAVNISSRLTQLFSKIKQRKNDQTVTNPVDYTWYTTEVAHIVVSVMRHYQSYLTLNSDLAIEAYNSFLSLTKSSGVMPAKSTSPDRSILVFLCDLYFNFAYIRAQHSEAFGSRMNNAKQIINSAKKPATSNHRYESGYMRNYIENPDAESALSVAERFSSQLNDQKLRYSFVCTAIITVCSGQQNLEKVNSLAALCAEMNARYNELSSEWLGVLKSLCCSSCANNFNDVLMAVRVSDPQIRDPLALFTAVLIARGCLSLEDVIQHVAIPSLLAVCNNKSSAGMPNPYIGARLTCHLLLQLFKAPNTSATSGNAFRLPISADRHQLAASQHNIAVGAVLVVLKVVLKLGDAGSSSSNKSCSNSRDTSVTSFLAPIGDFNDFDDMTDVTQLVGHPNQKAEDESLSSFANHALRVICSQQWVRERCLKDPVMDLLMEEVLTIEQRQNLVQLICYPEEDLQRLSSLSNDPRNYVVNVLSGMTRWTLRQCLLELQVMIKQCPQEKSLSEHIAKGTIEVFQQQQQIVESSCDRKSSLTGADLDRCNVWLIAPLVSKLPSSVQGQVLQKASTILETSQNWSATSTRSGATSRTDRQEHQGGGSSLLNHQPFLTLILTCLKGQDEQRDSLLESLQSQIIMLLTEWKRTRDAGKDFSYHGSSQNGVHDALQLRLSLVGGMFETVQSNTQWTSNVVVLLTQLINSGMVDVQVNHELFDIVFDMIAVLLHSTLGGDMSNRGEGSKREYLNIVKKIKKEIAEKQSESLKRLRQLLPIPRSDTYVICCEPTGPLMDIKGTKFPAPIDGTNQGLQVTSKQKLNTWEIIEGLKPAPLCLAWFGSKRTERKPLHYEYQHTLLLHHQHGFKSDMDEFLNPPQFPPEEEEEEVVQPPVISERKSGSSKSNGGSNMSIDPMKRPVSKAPKQKKKVRKPLESPHRNIPHNVPSTNMIRPISSNPHLNNYSPYPPQNQPYQQYPPGINQSMSMQNTIGTKNILAKHVLNRHKGSINVQMNPSYAQSNVAKASIRQRLGRTVPHNSGLDIYSNQNQPRQNMGMQSQPHMLNQQQNYTNYGNNSNMQHAGGMVSNYRNQPSQMGYQQQSAGPNNQRYINQPNQPQNSVYQMNTMQQNTGYSNQPSGLNIMQDQSQITMNHQNRNQHMTRMPMNSGNHAMTSGQGIQQPNMLNQRSGPMINQHQQIMNNQTGYNQQMSNQPQQQNNQMMGMQHNMMQQGPAPQY